MKFARNRLTDFGFDTNTVDHIISLIRSTFGKNTEIIDFEKWGGGLAKSTFKVLLEGYGNVLLQIFREPEHELTCINGEDVQQLWPGGSKQILDNTNFLNAIGVRVPELLAVSKDKPGIPDFIIFEFIEGKLFDEIDKYDISKSTYSRIGDLTGRLHSQTSEKAGTIFKADNSFDCMKLTYSVMLQELEITCNYDHLVREKQTLILDRLEFLRTQASHREVYHLIHGDSLQMIIDPNGDPVLIDIDAVQYFDLEYEYCIMDLLLSNSSFMEMYQKKIQLECDQNRLSYYRICKCISWLSYFTEVISKHNRLSLLERCENTRNNLFTTLESLNRI